MKIPEDVIEARRKMLEAEAALFADIESSGPADSVRRVRLLDTLQLAAGDYLGRLDRLRVDSRLN